jgi:hypothetical protein
MMTQDQISCVHRYVEEEKHLRKFIHDYDERILDECKILLLGHRPDQYDGEDRNYLYLTLLQDMDLGTYRQYQNNCFAESRAFLADMPEAEYVGVVTASWNRKFGPNKIDNFHNWDNTKILFNSGDKNIVLTAERSLFKHNDIFLLFNKGCIRDFEKFAISLTGEVCNFGLWSNQIICHRSVYLRLQEFYRRVFPLVVQKIFSYNLRSVKCSGMHSDQNLIYSGPEVGFNNRKEGLFFEFLTNLWFASQKDLMILPNAVCNTDWYFH